jgi:hypothetical protein
MKVVNCAVGNEITVTKAYSWRDCAFTPAPGVCVE